MRKKLLFHFGTQFFIFLHVIHFDPLVFENIKRTSTMLWLLWRRHFVCTLNATIDSSIFPGIFGNHKLFTQQMLVAAFSIRAALLKKYASCGMPSEQRLTRGCVESEANVAANRIFPSSSAKLNPIHYGMTCLTSVVVGCCWQSTMTNGSEVKTKSREREKMFFFFETCVRYGSQNLANDVWNKIPIAMRQVLVFLHLIGYNIGCVFQCKICGPLRLDCYWIINIEVLESIHQDLDGS